MSKANLTRQFSGSASARPSGGVNGDVVWTPNTDVYVHAAGAVIKVELAGISREDLELKVEGLRLTISGVRRDQCRTGKCSFQVMEIHYGAFESVVELPAGFDLAQARASYQNGFLRVDVPLLAGAKETS